MTFTKKSFGIIVSLLFLLSCLSQVSHADVSYEQKIKSSGTFGFGETETQGTVLLKGDRQKTVTETAVTGKLSKLMAKGGTKTVQITRLDKELMWNIDLDGKKYTEITFEEMKKMFGEMEKTAPELDSLKAEEEKAQEPKVEVSVTGEKKKIAGYPCEQVIVKMTMQGEDEGTGEKPTYMVNSDLWLTKDFPGQKEIKEFESKMSEKLGMGREQGEGILSAFTRFGVDVDKLSQEMEKVEGFPMLQTITMQVKGQEIEAEEEVSAEVGEEDLEQMQSKGLPKEVLGKEGENVIFSITTEVTDIKTDMISESEFELPPGLQKEAKR